jgi:hypothetical protein
MTEVREEILAMLMEGKSLSHVCRQDENASLVNSSPLDG